jgi:uncharacterized protein (DUF1778 family)
MSKAKSTSTPQPRFLAELGKREHEQTTAGRERVAAADAAVAELVARFGNTPERNEAILRAMKRAIAASERIIRASTD